MSKSKTIQLSALGEYKALIESMKNKLKALDNLTEAKVRDLAASAEAEFRNAPTTGENESSVIVSRQGNTIRVSAVGKSVPFIEFGTGISYPNSNPYASEQGVTHGSYGKGQGKNDYWRFVSNTGGGDATFVMLTADGRSMWITSGQTASMPMYRMSQRAKQDLSKLVRGNIKW